MDNKTNDDLHAIRSIMEKSSRFISLSGWSGVAAGIYALMAAAIALYLINDTLLNQYGRPRGDVSMELTLRLFILGITTLVLAVSTGIILTVRKTKRKGMQVWSKLTFRLLVHLFVPLLVGFIFCIVLYLHYVSYLIGATTLIFYGLALLNASKFTFSDIAYLGYLEILLGLIALFFPEFTLFFWAFGFGVLHIIYGLLIQRKYK